MSALNDIVAAMVAALAAKPAVSANIERARVRVLPETWTSAVVVRIESATLELSALAGAPIDTDTTVVVECYARSNTTAPDVAVDDLLAAVYARLAQNPTLNGLAADMAATGINYDFSTDAAQHACATVTYLVRHRTGALTLE